MTLIGFLVLLAIAAICGVIGQALAGYSVGGCLASTVVGLIGAFGGMWLARQFGLPVLYEVDIDGQSFPIVWSIIGSALFVAFLSLFTRRRRVA